LGLNLFKKYQSAFAGLHTNVWVISIVLLINRMGSMVLLFAPLYYTSSLHFTKAEAGFIMSFFGIGSIAGSYLGGWLADRFNQKKIMMVSLITSGIILLSINYTSNKYMLCLILFLYALSSDSFRPSSSVAITNSSSAENRTRSISLMRMAINLGFTIGPALGGIIAFNYGYSFLFNIDAASSFVAAAILFIFFPNINFNTHNNKQKQILDAFTSAYKDWHFLKFILLVSIYGICFFQLLASVPTFFKEVCKYNEDTIGYLMAFNGFLVVLIEMPLVAYLEKFRKKNLYIMVGCVQIVFALFFLVIGKGLMVMAVLYVFFITLSEIFAMPFMMNYSLARAHADRQGQYSALYSIGYGISFIIAPALGLYLAQHFGFQNTFIIFMCISILVGFGFYKLLK
jgi:predicted MFS family arabinose efflux permease